MAQEKGSDNNINQEVRGNQCYFPIIYCWAGDCHYD